jgi:hypothetical protein
MPGRTRFRTFGIARKDTIIVARIGAISTYERRLTVRDDRPMVMASTFRSWWQSLADQDPDLITRGNTLEAKQLWATLVTIGRRNGAVIVEHPGQDSTVGGWPELDPDFDWNGDIVLDADTPIAEIERATGISDDEPLA